jgi:small-conductance mechanosensitive channel
MFVRQVLELFNVRVEVLGLSFTAGELSLQFALPVGGLIGLYLVVLYLLRRFVFHPMELNDESTQRAYRIVRLLLRLAVILTVAAVTASFMGTELARFLASVWRILTTPFITAGATEVTIVTVVMMIPIFYIGTWLSRVVMRFVNANLLNNLQIAEGTRFTISLLLRNLIMIVAILIGLNLIGLDLSALSILFGVLGIGLGFGLQGFVANFFAGLTLIFERPIKEGDRILVSGLEGDVVQVRLRSTVINTLTNETIIVPNRNLVEDNVHNYSYSDPRIIITNRVSVSYSTDLEQAIEILLLLNETNPYALTDAQTEVRVLEFQDSGILLELRTWIKNAPDKHEALSWLNFEIWRAFRDAGVVIPFPQRDLHLKDIPPAVLREIKRRQD